MICKEKRKTNSKSVKILKIKHDTTQTNEFHLRVDAKLKTRFRLIMSSIAKLLRAALSLP